MFLKSLFSLSILVISLSSHAQTSDCLDSQKALDLFKEFQIMKTTEQVNVDLCDSRSMAYTVVKGLLFLKDLGDLASVSSPLNKNWISISPYDFFKARVKKIVLDDSANCVGLSQVWPSEREQKIIHLCTKAPEYNVLVLSEALVHEARHLEPIRHDHAICISGELYGKESCDETYESGGAYAVGVEYLLKISQTVRLDAGLRDQAHAMALKSLRERFNTTPMALTTLVTWRFKDKPKMYR